MTGASVALPTWQTCHARGRFTKTGTAHPRGQAYRRHPMAVRRPFSLISRKLGKCGRQRGRSCGSAVFRSRWRGSSYWPSRSWSPTPWFTVREKSCSGSRWPSTWCASRSPITIWPQLYSRKPDPTVNPVAGSGLSRRSQTRGRAAARKRGVSSGARGLRVEPDFQLVPGNSVDESGSSVTSPTEDAPRAVHLPSPSSSVQASRQAMQADGSGPEAPSVRSTEPGRSRASRRRRRDQRPGGPCLRP